MAENRVLSSAEKGTKVAISPNVKSSRESAKYDRFGETIRYMTFGELQHFFSVMDNYYHKLMMRMIYELGCRVGEFVRIQLKHLSFSRCSVFFPALNTKTGNRRTSHVPAGLMNEIKSMLRQEGRMARRSETIYRPGEFLFSPFSHSKRRYSENRLRQIFQHYVHKAGLQRDYGQDVKGRVLHELTIHSLRHCHIMHYVHVYKLPLPVVQKQVGHKNLKTTSIYLRPSDEHVGQAYAQARGRGVLAEPKALNTFDVLSFQNDSKI